MTILSIFTGAGGLDLGFESAGFQLVAAVERDADCAATLRRNRPGWPVIEMDVRRFEPDVGADVITAGPPCQGYTVGGRRDPDDSRNRLYEEIARITHAIRPRAVVMENVPGAMTLRPRGRCHTFAQKIARSFRGIGYSVRSARLDLSMYGVPQTRRRLFIIAGREAVPRDIFPSPDGRGAISLWLDPPTACLVRIDRGRPQRLYHVTGPAPTVDTGGRLAWMDGGVATPLTLEQLARLQTFPLDWRFQGAPASIRCQIGNAVPPLFAAKLAARIRAWLEKETPVPGKPSTGVVSVTSET